MVNSNSLTPFTLASTKDVHESLGVTKFIDGTDTNWYQLLGGLIIQGGYVTNVPADSSVVVTFNVAFTKKVLGIFVQPIYAPGAGQEASGLVSPGYSLTQFELGNDAAQKDFFWWAIGV